MRILGGTALSVMLMSYDKKRHKVLPCSAHDPRPRTGTDTTPQGEQRSVRDGIGISPSKQRVGSEHSS